MYRDVRKTNISGGDMPLEDKKKSEELIDIFEDRLQLFVFQKNIPHRYIRPYPRGAVICGSTDDSVFVGYHPHIGMPLVAFMKLTVSGDNPSLGAYHTLLMDMTGHDFSVIQLKKDWLVLPEIERTRTIDAVVLSVIQSELSRLKVQSTMIPFNPVFGPNKFPVQENLVFVLMPFEESLTQIYNGIVKPTVEAKNLVCRRGDDINSNNVIIHDIWKSICESHFVIADLSTRNPNVMYELGIAHTVGKETILIHQSDGAPNFPFDISHIRIINYENTAIGGNKLKDTLSGVIDSVLNKLSSAPISAALIS